MLVCIYPKYSSVEKTSFHVLYLALCLEASRDFGAGKQSGFRERERKVGVPGGTGLCVWMSESFSGISVLWFWKETETVSHLSLSPLCEICLIWGLHCFPGCEMEGHWSLQEWAVWVCPQGRLFFECSMCKPVSYDRERTQAVVNGRNGQKTVPTSDFLFISLPPL